MAGHLPLAAPVAVTLLGALYLGACAGGDATAEDDAGRTTVAATTSIWADVAAEVLCGAPVEVVTVVPPGADAHSFDPSLADRKVLGEADLVLANGLGLEAGLAEAIEAVDREGVEVFEVGEEVVSPLVGGGGSRAGDDDHDGEDPHIWNDPTLVLAVMPGLVDALAGLPGVERSSVERCGDAYASRLAAVDASVAATLDGVPEGRRKMVTSHDAFSYLADRYAFEVIGTVIPSTSTLAETNPAHAESLAAKVAEEGVPAVFAETGHGTRDTEALARRLDGVEVVTLWSGTLGEEGSGAESYLEMLQTNAERIADALG